MTKIDIKYKIKIGNKYVKNLDEWEYYEIERKEDYRINSYEDYLYKNFLTSDDASVKLFSEDYGLPKYSIGEERYWGDSAEKKPTNIREVLKHYTEYFPNYSIIVYKITTKTEVTIKEEQVSW